VHRIRAGHRRRVRGGGLGASGDAPILIITMGLPRSASSRATSMNLRPSLNLNEAGDDTGVRVVEQVAHESEDFQVCLITPW